MTDRGQNPSGDQPEKKKALFAWSGGKDSTLALHQVISEGQKVSALLTTVTEDYDRISMHGVRTALLEAQGRALNLPVERVYIPKDASNEAYESRMKEKLIGHQARGVSSVIFGDIFLEDLRQYRERNLEKIGMRAIFPIWKQNTKELAERFIRMGFKAVVTCVDSEKLDPGFSGREFDASFLSDLPASVDPCGENGEFHSFVYDGPLFNREIPVRKGDVVCRDSRFYFCDLIPT